jgi:hypothetical protein
VETKIKLVSKVYANEYHLPSKILSRSKCLHKPQYWSGHNGVHSAASGSVRSPMQRLHNKERLQKGRRDITQCTWKSNWSVLVTDDYRVDIKGKILSHNSSVELFHLGEFLYKKIGCMYSATKFR